VKNVAANTKVQRYFSSFSLKREIGLGVVLYRCNVVPVVPDLESTAIRAAEPQVGMFPVSRIQLLKRGGVAGQVQPRRHLFATFCGGGVSLRDLYSSVIDRG
jgi:hypothetical protein